MNPRKTSSCGSFYMRNLLLSFETLVYMWIEPYLSHSLYKSFQTMVCAIRSPMQWHPSNRKLYVCFTGNEINKAFSNIKKLRTLYFLWCIWIWIRNFADYCKKALICSGRVAEVDNAGTEIAIVNMNVIHRLPPFCAVQNRIFLEHSAENYETCLVVTFYSDSCALELTQLRDWKMLLSTAACHINLETLWLQITIHSFTIFTWKMRLILNLIYLSFVVQYT